MKIKAAGKAQGFRIVRDRLLPVLAVLLVLMQPGCASFEKKVSEFAASIGQSRKEPENAEGLASEGLYAFNHGRYDKAAEIFGKLKDRFPFSNYSLLAELKIADSQYYMDNYEEARLLYGEFEERHPTNEAVPYIMFQAGMCGYNLIGGHDRDISGATDSIEAFSRLLRTFPESPYTEEARARIIAARNFLANHEFYVGNFFVRTGSYDQAEARLEYLISQYPDAVNTPAAQKLLADLKAGKPPKSSWRSWLPDLELPDWRMFSNFFGKSGGKGKKAEEAGAGDVTGP